MLKNLKRMEAVKSIKDISVKDKKVLIRVDFNVPMDDNLDISDDSRIKEALATINYIIDAGAKYIVLVSHLGRPKGAKIEKYSLRHIVKRVERLLDRDVIFINNFEDKIEREKIDNTNHSQIILLENIRYYAGETNNDIELSKKLADLCDVYINDAFGTAHRKHSSTYGITEFVKTKVAGLLIKKETKAFMKALTNPTPPITLIVGGAKVSSKITLLKSILNTVDKVIIGGAMSNTFLKALGNDMQKSLVEDDYLYEALQILETAKYKNVKIYLPVDVITTDDLKDTTHTQIVPIQDITKNFMAVDIGPATIKLFQEVIGISNTIIWNGPMGIYEIDKFSRGTFRLAHTIGDSYTYSVIGGGDTADAVDRAGEKENMSFISTGGGASLELLEGKFLPAFEVLENIKNV